MYPRYDTRIAACKSKTLEANSVLKSQIPQTPRRSLRPRAPTTPDFSKQKSPEKRKSPQKTRSPQKNTTVAVGAPKDLYYTIRGILDENETNYLVDWEDIGSQSFSPTWEPKSTVTDLAIKAWEEDKKVEKR